MSTLRSGRSGLAALAGLALLTAACTDEPVVPPSAPPSFSEVGDVTPTDNHIIAASGANLAKVQQQVAALGGSVLRSHPEVGIIIASGLSDAAAASLKGTTSVMRDVELKLIPDPEGDGAGITQELTEPTPLPHDPTTAFFFTLGWQWDMQIINADDAWNAGFSGNSGVRVAILDTGLDPYHADLAGLIDAGSSVAFVPYVPPAGFPPAPAGPVWMDDHTHGSHVGGTVASNGVGTSGVAPHTTLIAVKVCWWFGSCPFSAIISGIVHAVNVNADVINMSLGGAFAKNLPGAGRFHGFLNTVMNYAARNGVLVVSAAGNAAADMDHDGNLFWNPCQAGNGMCISSTGPTDAPAFYTNYGTSSVDVAAPGGDSSQPFPSTVLAPCSTGSFWFPVCRSSPFWYVFFQGTSMATPHVAGAAALLKANGGGSPAQLRTALQQTADDLGKNGADPFYGKGRLNVCSLVNC